MKADNQEQSWPPPYSMRRSGRAKRVSLRVSHERGLEIVVPEGGRLPEAERLLDVHKDWILARLDKREAFLRERSCLQGESPLAAALPGFQLHGGAMRVKLDILPGRGQGAAFWSELFRNMLENLDAAPGCSSTVKLLAEEAAQGGNNLPGLAVSADWGIALGTRARMQENLCLCIRSYARYYLQKRLARLAAFYRLDYSGFGLGKQKSRWGSFAPGGRIRLNCKLVFIPRELSDHVILHELCHSVHCNHSSDFWALLRQKDQGAAEKNSELLKVDVWIPSWFN